MTTSRLAPCASCARHVRVGGDPCPFCGASTDDIVAPVVRRGVLRRRARWTRAALFAGGAILGTTALGCGPSSSEATEETTVEEPPPDTSGDEMPVEEGTTEEGTTDEGTTEEDVGEPQTMYGGPPADVLV